MDYRLFVDRQQLLEGLRHLKTRRRKFDRGDRAIFGFDGICLTIEADDALIFARAFGAWPGNAYTSPNFVQALARAAPASDPLIARCDGEHLHVGVATTACRWRPVSATPQQLPATRDWIQSLSIRYMLPRGQIIREGLVVEIAEAEERLDKLVAKAGTLLMPFGVHPSELHELVERKLMARYGNQK